MKSQIAQPKSIPTRIRSDVTYYEHQVEGIRWLARRSSFILGDDQGLGKTLQALTVAALDFDRGWAEKILVISPASLKENWADEIDKWTHFSSTILEGNPVQRRAFLDAFETDILIVNYEQVKAHWKQLNSIGFDIAIVDECQDIKNWNAQRTQAVHQLVAKRWFMLSGTLVETRPDELWSPMRLVDPANTPAYWVWCNMHCVYASGTRIVIGVKRKERLRGHIEQIFLRRLKTECLDLPEKQYIKINVELNPWQRELHDQVRDELWLHLPHDPDPMELESGLMKALRLRQICSTPANLEGLEDDSGKLDAAIYQLRLLTEAGNKVVVFTDWRGTLACLEQRCSTAGIPFFAVHGGIPRRERHPIISSWKKHEGPAVFAGTYGTIGKGLNLTEARHALIVDKQYGPGAMTQAEDRIYRIGTGTQPVQIIELIARGTYEQRIEEILTSKGEMIDELIPNSGWRQKLYAAILEGRPSS